MVVVAQLQLVATYIKYIASYPGLPSQIFFGAMGNVCFSTAAKKTVRRGMDTRLYRVHM